MGGFYPEHLEQRKESVLCLGPSHSAPQQKAFEKSDSASSSEWLLIPNHGHLLIICEQIFFF